MAESAGSRAVDLRPQLRKLISFILGLQIFWFYLIAVGSQTPKAQLLLVGLLEVFFLSLHSRIINSFGFFTELADFSDRGPYQTVIAHGDWLEKRVDLKIKRDKSVWSESPWLSGAGIFYWACANYVLQHLFGAFSVVLFGFSALLIWLWSSPRALMWVPISCISLFLTLWVAHSNVVHLISVGLFFSFLSIYSYSYFFYSSRASAIDVVVLAKSLVRPAVIFVAAFLLAAYFFPDGRLKAQLAQAKSELAEKLAKTTGAARSQARAGQNGKGGGRGGSNASGGAGGAKPGDGSAPSQAKDETPGSSGAADGPSESNKSGATKSQADNGGSGGDAKASDSNGGGAKAPGPNAAQNSKSAPDDGSGGDDGGSGGGGDDGDPTAGSSSPANSSEKPALDKAKLAEKIQNVINRLEGFFKVMLVMGLAIMLARFLLNRPAKNKKASERSARRKLKNVIREIEALYAQKFNSQRDEILATYHTFLNAMNTIGAKKLDWQTPEQFCSEVSKFSAHHQEIAKTLTKGFTQAYYGEEPISEVDFKAFRQSARQLKRIVGDR